MVAPHTGKQRVARAEVTQHKHTPSVHYTLLWIRISKACDLHYLLFYYYFFYWWIPVLFSYTLKGFTWWKVILLASHTDKKKVFFKLVIGCEHFHPQRTPFNFSHQGRYFRTFAPRTKAWCGTDIASPTTTTMADKLFIWVPQHKALSNKMQIFKTEHMAKYHQKDGLVR